MKQRQGFSLIELLIAISVFSIVMIALTSLIVQGLQLRRINELETQAQAYAATVLERYKTFLSDDDSYDTYKDSAEGIEEIRALVGLPPAPSGFPDGAPTLDVFVNCIDLEGANVTCGAEPPPLRRIRIIMRDSAGKVYADLITEVGDPSLD